MCEGAEGLWELFYVHSVLFITMDPPTHASESFSLHYSRTINN